MPPIPKPTKRTRPGEIRKRRIKRLDRKLSKETRKRPCVVCGKPATDTAHIIPRRFQKFRFDPNNANPKCRQHHQEEKHDKVTQRIRILHSNPLL